MSEGLVDPIAGYLFVAAACFLSGWHSRVAWERRPPPKPTGMTHCDGVPVDRLGNCDNCGQPAALHKTNGYCPE